MSEHNDNSVERIAVIGMAARFPDAATPEQFWQNLRAGKHSLTRFTDAELRARGVPEEILSDPAYVKAGVSLDNIDLFDGEFFGYNAREAESIDPQQRIFLELAWEALEDAGCNPDAFPGAIGVFGGTGASDYGKRIGAGLDGVTSGFDAFQAMLGNDVDFLATRVSYKLNLTGPSFTLQTACSTSLVAVHVACQHLLTYQCDLALAGGVSIRLPQGVGYTFRDGMIWSPDGFCRAFDAQAQGTIFGRGAGIVVLKRLSEAIADRDCIRAVIRGSAINNDGALKVGYTAPSVDGQAEVISVAQALSDIEPDTIGYIETHGTGTKLGDPIEIEALTKAFRSGTDKNGFCAIGSVKTNIGHLDVAAGIAGFIKTALAVQHGEIPPSLHFNAPNPNIDFGATPFYVATALQPWPATGHLRRAGVSSFGIGGTNAHVIVEEAGATVPAPSSRSSQLLLLSAKSEGALGQLSGRLADHLREHPETSLADAAYTLHLGRKAFRRRRFVVGTDSVQAGEALAAPVETAALPAADSGRAGLVFMFSGQGSQYTTMCQGLYTEEPFFREQLDFCADALKPHVSLDLRDVLFPAAAADEEATRRINQTALTQPALFSVEYALARLLMSWGLAPQALVGHSIGEYVAACLAGVFAPSDALALVAARGRMMQELEPGTMLAVPLAEDEVAPLLPPELSIAVINAPKMTVVSGPTPAVAAFREHLLAERQLECRPLHTSHAFHSGMMGPIVGAFSQLVATFPRQRPTIPFVSNLSGTWITEEQATSPDYWARHLRHAVRFHACLTTLFTEGHRTFIEVGPGQVLTQLARQHPQGREGVIVATTRRPVERKADLACLQSALGQLWQAGVDLDGAKLYGNEQRNKIPLPSCPFQRQRFWLGPPENLIGPAAPALQANAVPAAVPGASVEPPPEIQGPTNDLELQIAAVFRDLLGVRHLDVRRSFFDIGGDSLGAAQLLAGITKACHTSLSLADIFENPSVAALASLIEKGGGKLRSAVLPLNDGPGEHLLYFVVGINIYHALAQQLRNTARCFGTFLPVEETLFGSGSDQARWQVADLAAAYREEIAKHSQGRPLSLAGVSFGGVVAFELARQLSQAGRSIPLLVMMDSLLPSGMHRDLLRWAAAQGADIARHGFGPALDKLRTKLAARTAKTQRTTDAGPVAGQGVPDQRLLVYSDAVDRFEATAAQVTYNGRTLLIRARDEVRYPGYRIDPHFGWQKHLTGPFHVDTAPGDHLGLLQPPHVQVTAALITQILRGNN